MINGNNKFILSNEYKNIDENEKFIFCIGSEEGRIIFDGRESTTIQTSFIYCKNFNGIYLHRLLIECEISYDFFNRVVIPSLVKETQKKGGMTFEEIKDYVEVLKNDNK